MSVKEKPAAAVTTKIVDMYRVSNRTKTEGVCQTSDGYIAVQPGTSFLCETKPSSYSSEVTVSVQRKSVRVTEVTAPTVMKKGAVK